MTVPDSSTNEDIFLTHNAFSSSLSIRITFSTLYSFLHYGNKKNKNKTKVLSMDDKEKRELHPHLHISLQHVAFVGTYE